MDPQELRAESRQRWEDSAAGWGRRRAQLQEAAGEVSQWMIDAINPQPGYRMLELAAGPADTGLLAAEVVQPGGTVLITDVADAMLEVAKARAAELGIANVEFKQMDAEWIDAEAASFDGVLCRFGYMLLVDPGAALRETRRVLKPHGRVALAAWAAPDDNPWMTVLGRELVRRGLAPPPDPTEPGPFVWAEEGVIEVALQDAGFTEITVETLELEARHESVEAWLEQSADCSARVRAGTAHLGWGERHDLISTLRELTEPYHEPGGGLRFPMRTWVAAASA